jgi:hypothetical protein
MWDGSLKPIDSVNIGEYVLNPVTGQKSKIVNVVAGVETKPMIRIIAGDQNLRLSGMRLSGIKLFAHRFLPKIPPLSAFTTPPLRQPESVLLLDFAIWQGNAPKSPLIQRCVGQKWQTPAVLGQFG